MYKTLPDSVNPGDDFSVRVILENNGLSRADEIVVSVNAISRTIAPKTPGNYYFERLFKGENITLDMNFATDKNAPLGLRLSSWQIWYANADGTFNRADRNPGHPHKGKGNHRHCITLN